MQATDQATDIDSIVDGLLEPEQAEDGNPTGPDDEPENEAADVEAADEAGEADDDDEGEEIDAPDEDEDDEGEDEGEEQPERITVKVDGREVEVTLDDLKRGYAGQAYIQKGMQEAAAAKKEADGLRQTLQQEREQLSQFYASLQQRGAITMPQPPTEEMANTDPVGYMQARARYDREMTEWQGQQTQAQQLTQRQQAEQNQARAAYLAEQQRVLLEAVPEFGDPQKAADLKGKLTSFAVERGVPAEAVAQITDAATVALLYDAYRYREAQKSIGEKTAKARKTVKPGRKKSDADTRQRAQEQKRKRLRSEGSIDAAVDFILNMD